MKIFTAIGFLFLVGVVNATVWVYPGAHASFKSDVYEVVVMQGDNVDTSFVYKDANTFTDKKGSMTDFNHWTTFSFSETVTVKIKKLSGSISSCKIYPLIDSILPAINDNEVTFTLNKPAKLFVELNGMYEHPLFVFGDAPETNIPDKNASNVVWYGPGVHTIGQKAPLQSNKIYYFEGGSYVKGSFYGSNISNVKFLGRGILSGIDIPHCGYSSCGFDGVAIHLNNGGSNQLIDGITLTNSSSYLVLSRGQITCRNMKGFGWWYETDGFGAGDNSLIEDCFFKVNDDVVKLYPKNMVVKNLVIYQQMNGAPFQYAWSGQSGQNGKISDIDIIACEVTGSSLWTSNKALVNMRNGVGNNVSGFVFDGIRADKNICSLIGINTTGSCSNITIKNVTVKGRQLYSSYLKGTVSGIKIENVVINGSCVSDNASISLATQGAVEPVSYFCTSSGISEPVVKNNFPITLEKSNGQLLLSTLQNIPFSFSLYDAQGKKIMCRNVNESFYKISTATLKPGVYVVNVKCNGKSETFKTMVCTKL